MPQCEVVTSFPAQAHERLRYRACAWNHRVFVQCRRAGTQGLAELPEGSEMDIVGPLGNTFTLKPEFRRVMVVARGVGLATMAPFAAASCSCRYRSHHCYVGTNAGRPDA